MEHVLSHVVHATFAAASGRVAPTAAATPRPTRLAYAPDEEHELPMVARLLRRPARRLGVTTRTLHRHLAAEDESFSEIVHRTREAHAERYLAAERNSLTDVSAMLGFAAPSAFSRWFRQRFGISPTEWRAGTRPTAIG